MYQMLCLNLPKERHQHFLNLYIVHLNHLVYMKEEVKEPVVTTDNTGSTESDEIERDATQKLNEMSQQEIIANQEFLLNHLDPKIVEMIKKRNKEKADRKAASVEKGQGPLNPTNKVKFYDPIGDLMEDINPSKPLPPPVVPEVKAEVKEKQPDEEMPDWMKSLRGEDQAAIGFKETLANFATWRFNFEGCVIKRGAEEIPTHLGLHHHGDEAAEAGYTMAELIMLCKSTNISQRTIALRILTAIIHKIHNNYYNVPKTLLLKEVLKLKLPRLVRQLMDDKVPTVLLAALQCLHAMMVPVAEEEAYEMIESRCHRAYEFIATKPLVAEVKISNKLPGGSAEDEESLDDDERCLKDLIQGMFDMGLANRLKFLLQANEAQDYDVRATLVLDILIRITRHSVESSTALLSTHYLVEMIITNVLPRASLSVKGVRLIRRLCQASRDIASKLFTAPFNAFSVIRSLYETQARENRPLLLEILKFYRIVAVYQLQMPYLVDILLSDLIILAGDAAELLNRHSYDLSMEPALPREVLDRIRGGHYMAILRAIFNLVDILVFAVDTESDNSSRVFDRIALFVDPAFVLVQTIGVVYHGFREVDADHQQNNAVGVYSSAIHFIGSFFSIASRMIKTPVQLTTIMKNRESRSMVELVETTTNAIFTALFGTTFYGDMRRRVLSQTPLAERVSLAVRYYEGETAELWLSLVRYLVLSLQTNRAISKLIFYLDKAELFTLLHSILVASIDYKPAAIEDREVVMANNRSKTYMYYFLAKLMNELRLDTDEFDPTYSKFHHSSCMAIVHNFLPNDDALLHDMLHSTIFSVDYLEAIGYIFSAFLWVFLRQYYPVRYRRLVWNELFATPQYLVVPALAGPDVGQLPLGDHGYLEPYDNDTDLLQIYKNSILQQKVTPTKALPLYTLAKHHLVHHLFDNPQSLSTNTIKLDVLKDLIITLPINTLKDFGSSSPDQFVQQSPSVGDPNFVPSSPGVPGSPISTSTLLPETEVVTSLFASYQPSMNLRNSDYMFQVTPTFYAAKKNQKIGVFLHHSSEPNRLHMTHPQLRLKLQTVAPYWSPSSFTRKDNKKNIDSIASTQFETLETTLKKGEALFGPVRIQKTGFYFLRCSVELSPVPSAEELKFADFHFSFKIYFYGSPSKKKNGGGGSGGCSMSPSDESDPSSDNLSISNINVRPNENLLNYISHLQETGARWRDLENVFEIYFKKYEKNPEVLAELCIEQAIGSTFVGRLGDAHVLMDRGLEKYYSPETLFKVSYLKSAIFRIQKNFTASKLHLDTCDFLQSKIELNALHKGQYFYNKASHDADLFVLQKTKPNNYNQVRDQIVEKFKTSADYYAKDYESASANTTTNARSINGTYRANIRITQTILGSNNPTKLDLDRAESFLAKIPNIQAYTFTQRTQVHLLFTWSDLMLAKSYHFYRSNSNLSFHMLTQCLDFINKSSTYASRLGFNNEIRYTTERYQKLYNVAPKSFVNTLMGLNLLGSTNAYISTNPSIVKMPSTTDAILPSIPTSIAGPQPSSSLSSSIEGIPTSFSPDQSIFTMINNNNLQANINSLKAINSGFANTNQIPISLDAPPVVSSNLNQTLLTNLLNFNNLLNQANSTNNNLNNSIQTSQNSDRSKVKVDIDIGTTDAEIVAIYDDLKETPRLKSYLKLSKELVKKSHIDKAILVLEFALNNGYELNNSVRQIYPHLLISNNELDKAILYLEKSIVEKYHQPLTIMLNRCYNTKINENYNIKTKKYQQPTTFGRSPFHSQTDGRIDALSVNKSNFIAINQFGGLYLSGPEAPLNLSTLKIKAVSCGKFLMMAMTTDNAVYSWGEQFLNANAGPHYGPADDKFAQISAGYYHSAAVTEKGKLYTWGTQFYGRLGLGLSDRIVRTPQKVQRLDSHVVAKVSAGGFHTAVITQEGKLFTFGRNHRYQLGYDLTHIPEGYLKANPSSDIQVPESRFVTEMTAMTTKNRLGNLTVTDGTLSVVVYTTLFVRVAKPALLKFFAELKETTMTITEFIGAVNMALNPTATNAPVTCSIANFTSFLAYVYSGKSSTNFPSILTQLFDLLPPATRERPTFDASTPLSDIIVVSGQLRFHCHRAVLAARSPTLCEELLDNETAKEITIPETPLASSLLAYLYTDSLKFESSMTGDQILQLIDVTSKLRIDRLNLGCQKLVTHSIDDSNAIDLLTYSVSKGFTRLSIYLADYIIHKDKVFPDSFIETLSEDLQFTINSRGEFNLQGGQYLPRQVTKFSDVAIVDVAAGEKLTIVKDSNGTVWQIGCASHPDKNTRYIEVVKDAGDNAMIAAGSSHGVILKEDMTIYSWGTGFLGQVERKGYKFYKEATEVKLDQPVVNNVACGTHSTTYYFNNKNSPCLPFQEEPNEINVAEYASLQEDELWNKIQNDKNNVMDVIVEIYEPQGTNSANLGSEVSETSSNSSDGEDTTGTTNAPKILHFSSKALPPLALEKLVTTGEAGQPKVLRIFGITESVVKKTFVYLYQRTITIDGAFVLDHIQLAINLGIYDLIKILGNQLRKILTPSLAVTLIHSLAKSNVVYITTIIMAYINKNLAKCSKLDEFASIPYELRRQIN
eukprot:gene6718-7811_t